MVAAVVEMRYVGLSIKEIMHLRIVTLKNVTQYYLRNLLPNQTLLENTRKLRGSKKGKCAFVFANGPSMKILNPNKVKAYSQSEFDVFAVNSYINSDFARVVTPNYYVLSDPAHFGWHLNLLTEQRKQEVLEDVEKIRKSGAILFVPVEFYHSVINIETYAFCDSENLFSDKVSDITKPRCYLSLTAYKALSIACYLGYEKIYICGFDNNYFKTVTVNEDNDLYYADEHFYTGNQSPKPLYRVKENEGKDIGELLFLHHFMFKGLAKFSRLPIINLDKNGLVDCFSKLHELDLY